VSNTQPPDGGQKPTRAQSGGARKAATPDASGKVAKGQGSGRKGKVKMRDLHGKAKAKHALKKTAKWGAIVGVVMAVLAAAASTSPTG
jgi:hypothetical protein